MNISIHKKFNLPLETLAKLSRLSSLFGQTNEQVLIDCIERVWSENGLGPLVVKVGVMPAPAGAQAVPIIEVH